MMTIMAIIHTWQVAKQQIMKSPVKLVKKLEISNLRGTITSSFYLKSMSKHISGVPSVLIGSTPSKVMFCSIRNKY